MTQARRERGRESANTKLLQIAVGPTVVQVLLSGEEFSVDASATHASVLSPDFYNYAWTPVQSVELRDHFVDIRWSDGAELRAFDLWLRENAVGQGGIDPATREALLDPAELGDDVAVIDASVSSSGSVVVTFAPDGTRAEYHPGWLRHVADGHHRPSSWLPAPQPWTAQSLPEPPTQDASAVLTDDAEFAGWLDNLLRFGLARLRNCPTDPDFLGELATRVGAIRDTNFGHVWDVMAKTHTTGDADTNSTANTNLRLGPHTDLPTRETPPGFQFLHCLANEADGGWSTMADGAAVVAALRNEHRDHFDALSTLRWIFFNRGVGVDHRWSGPLIDLGVAGSPLTLRAFYPVRAFPDMAPEDQPRAYAAMRCFSQLADSDRFKISYPFAPGDLIAFDNRRILHGREAFISGGHRHLRGMYIDHDDVRSTARVTFRRLNTPKN